MMNELTQKQVDGLEDAHFQILYWTAVAEDRGVCYNITNVFDDLKYSGLTRTKQSAVSYIDVLRFLQFIEVKEEGNRKNLYISKEGAQALERLINQNEFTIKNSLYLEKR